REVFEAQLLLDQKDYATAANRAFGSMLQGAKGLLLHQRIAVADDAASVVAAFRTHFFDTELFFDPFRGGSLAQYFFSAYDSVARNAAFDEESTHMLVEEAQLFLEGCHSCYARLISQPTK